jgi:hypothetical protein
MASLLGTALTEPDSTGSILTTWTNTSNQLELVTTGDGLASHILDGMKQIQPNLTTDLTTVLEVFKVPHHGSAKNSQLGNLTTDIELEKKHHLFMVLALCYIDVLDVYELNP